MAVELHSAFEVRLNYRVNNQNCVNVFHYRNTAAIPDPVTPRDVTVAFHTAFGGMGAGQFEGEFAKVFAANVEITEIDFQAVYPVRWLKTVGELGTPGLHPGSANAQNVQWTFTKRGLLADRHAIGSMHVGGVPDSVFEEGWINDAFQDKANVLIDFIRANKVLPNPIGILEFGIINKAVVQPPTIPPKYKYNGIDKVFETQLQRTLRTQRTRTWGKGQ